MKPPDILICAFIRDVPRGPSFIATCACGAQVWVSNTLRARVEARHMVPTCHSCAPNLLIQRRPKAMIHHDQIEELRALGLLHVTQDVVTGINRATRRKRRRRK